MGQKPSVITISNTTAQTAGSGGVGFRLEPLTNAATGNPVSMSARVRLNRNDSLVYLFTDDAARYFTEPFEVVELLGGTAGDRWLVTIFEGVADGVGSPARVLQPSPLLARKVTWTAADTVPGTTYAVAGVNGAVNASPHATTPPIDVSGWSVVTVLSIVRLQKDPAQPTSSPTMDVVLEWLAGPEAGATPYRSHDLHYNAPTGSVGHIVIGAGMALGPDELPEDGLRVDNIRPSYLRLSYTIRDVNPAFRPTCTSELALLGAR